MPTVNEITIQTYDVIARRREATRIPSFWMSEFVQFAELVPGKRILDLGCGDGRDAALFLERGFEYLGVDASRSMLERARLSSPSAAFKQMNFYDLDLPDNNFDGLWATASLLHLPKTDVAAVLTAVRKSLRPNAVGFITFKEYAGTPDGLVPAKDYGSSAVRYFSFWQKGEFEAVASAAGFEILDMTEHPADNTNYLCYWVRNAGNTGE